MGTDIHIAVEVWRDGAWHLADVDASEDRNYWAFAVLANVRNGYGFAGMDTGEAIQPISEPRGLPEDMSAELRAKLEACESNDFLEEDEYIWLGDHSHSWVTLGELLQYDLGAPMLVTGFVSEKEAQHYRETGEFPTSHMAWTSQPGFVKMSWVQPVSDRAPLIGTLIEELRPLGAPDEVRIVFGFDN